MTRYFHFTLGPVQGFVAQARRTRDFWAGSFLLSYLAGVAMLETKHQQGEILFPEPDPNYLDWIKNGHGPQQEPKHGGIPNRFMAKVSDDFQPSKVKKAVKTAWRELAEQVWKKDFREAFGDTETRKIWVQQIDSFWDIAWAMVEDENDTSVLDRRKNWRSHYLPPQKGMKCMAMEGMRELSGAERLGEGQSFWKQLWESNRRRIATDLRENERLCAIAYVKRRFVHYFEGFTADMPSGWKTHGWYLEPHMNSVAHLAARPWLNEVEKLSKARPVIEEKLRAFYHAARVLSDECETTDDLYDWNTVEELAFFEADLRNAKLFKDRDKAEQTIKALTALRKTAALGPPAPYYALLLMDGDSLGRHMSDPGKRGLISAALNAFTCEVQTIVEQGHSGFLIYAGGDDVLALLTLNDALPCAEALRKRYMEAFEAQFQKKPEHRFTATISAAIQYAHYRLPFTKILADAHDLLDEVAKDGRGRDAVAARVWKQSGLHATWAQPWAIALQKGKEDIGIIDLVKQLQREETQVAGGFFYRMRDLFKLLDSAEVSSEDRIGAEDMVKLLAYEYAHSGIHGGSLKQKEAEKFIRPLLAQCQPMRRKADDPQNVCFKPDAPERYEADAALLARFLANRGNERD